MRKAVECFKWSLKGHTNRNMEDNGAEGYLNSGELTQGVSVEKNVSMWPRDCSCDILANNLAAFCPYLKSLPQAGVLD